MELPTTIWPPASFSPEDKQSTKNLYATLCGLKFNIDAWEAALALYKYAKAAPYPGVDRALAWQWKWIAVHECIMQTYHLGERLQLLRATVGKCRPIATYVDAQELRHALRLFDASFPGSEQLRHTIAHWGTMDTVPSKHALHGGYALHRLTDDDQFEAPYEGVMYTLGITQESLDKLTGIVRTFFRGFAPAAQELARLGNSDA